MDDVSVAESDCVSDHLAFEWQLWFQLLEVGEADSKHLCSLVHINQFRNNIRYRSALGSKVLELGNDLPIFRERNQVGFR